MVCVRDRTLKRRRIANILLLRARFPYRTVFKVVRICRPRRYLCYYLTKYFDGEFSRYRYIYRKRLADFLIRI